ncbi:hypothetical protein ACLI08_07855 [Flavobacterium sp. RNTU_13]|uniref:hypothetical protein n=1 Tax=Flavobacterium sp. RNTU_13 TaxID=3375145 RepID=UPI003985EFF7
MIRERFTDENKLLTEFQSEVWVKCPCCEKKAIAIANCETKTARLFCINCSYLKEISTETESSGGKLNIIMAAHRYFDAELWLQYQYKSDVFLAYNDQHLYYLEHYISAKLREHKTRTHFTLLEKLPKFYHEGKNRKALLKIIKHLKTRF